MLANTLSMNPVMERAHAARYATSASTAGTATPAYSGLVFERQK